MVFQNYIMGSKYNNRTDENVLPASFAVAIPSEQIDE